MIKNLKYIIAVLFITIIITGCTLNKKNSNNINIIVSNFPSYDFARAITKNVDGISVNMLLKPGTEMHDYEPTPQDIINISKSNLFIYTGGESDDWLEDIISDIDKTKTIKLMELVDVVEEEITEEMEKEESNEEENEEEYDEHVWTSPINAIKIIEQLKEKIIEIDSKNKELYELNANNYISQLKNIDENIRDIIKNSKRKKLIFADRFPFRYFTLEYGLEYAAAFPGCSSKTEPSAKTISNLIKITKEQNIPVILHIELSNEKLAQEIANNTGAKVREFNSAHNISLTDFESGITYVDIMNKNIEVLKEALN